MAAASLPTIENEGMPAETITSAWTGKEKPRPFANHEAAKGRFPSSSGAIKNDERNLLAL